MEYVRSCPSYSPYLFTIQLLLFRYFFLTDKLKNLIYFNNGLHNQPTIICKNVKCKIKSATRNSNDLSLSTIFNLYVNLNEKY